MNKQEVEGRLQDVIHNRIVDSYDRLFQHGYVVYVCAMFDDGDHPVVLLKRRSTRWWFTDDGNTLLRQGLGAVEMRVEVNRDGSDFESTLRMFVLALLAVDASRTKV